MAQYSVTLCLDGIKVNDISFLTTVSKNLMYPTAWYIQRPLASIYRKCLQLCSKSIPWEDFALLWFIVTTNFAPHGPFSSQIQNSSEICKSTRACPGSRAQQSSHQGTSPYDLPPPTIQSPTLHHGESSHWWFYPEAEFLPCQKWNLSVLQSLYDFASAKSQLWQALSI